MEGPHQEDGLDPLRGRRQRLRLAQIPAHDLDPRRKPRGPRIPSQRSRRDPLCGQLGDNLPSDVSRRTHYKHTVHAFPKPTPSGRNFRNVLDISWSSSHPSASSQVAKIRSGNPYWIEEWNSVTLVL
ncbi:hypothetical protein JMUB6875_62110 [Nocardia sp. JMUB6875]